MTAEEVDAFFRVGRRSLPAAPDWRDGNRAAERRASLGIALDGVMSPVTLEVTIRLTDDRYLMMLLLCNKHVICRLCMATGHWDRINGVQTTDAHFHSWEANRTSRNTIPKRLNQLEIVPPDVLGRDRGFVWFLERTGIEYPSWAASIWPLGQGML